MLARIVRAGQSTPHRGFGLGLARLPVETTAKPWKPQWKPAPEKHNFCYQPEGPSSFWRCADLDASVGFEL